MQHCVPPNAAGEHLFEVQPSETGTRLDKFLSDRLAALGVSRSKIGQLIRAEHVYCEGQVCLAGKQKVRQGECYRLHIPEAQTTMSPDEGPLEILYRDADLLVVNKSAGMTVHPGTGGETGTLVHRLLAHFPQLAQMQGQRPGIVHRLDKDTSGLLVVALHDTARLALSRSFAQRVVHKEYLALVHGCPEPHGEVQAPMGRDPQYKTRMAVRDHGGREAKTYFTRLWTTPERTFSLLRVHILTGRTHQIRVHMAHVGHPLLGDTVYGPQAHAALRRSAPLLARLAKHHMLHAWRLRFPHPRTGTTIACEKGWPKALWRLVLGLSRRVQRIGLTGMPGCGKSTFLGALHAVGVPTWSADREVHDLYAPGGDGAVLLSQRFGDCVLNEQGGVNTRALLARMQQDPGVRREVEGLIHPLVRHRLTTFWQSVAQCRVAVAEAPLLFEAGWAEGVDFDVLVGVYCRRELRRRRLRASRGWSDTVLSGLESWQFSEQAKLSRCHVVVSNNAQAASLQRRARVVLGILRRERLRRVRRVWQEIQIYTRTSVQVCTKDHEPDALTGPGAE